jgi:sugar phosphate isomerase/epimerase
VDAETKKRIEDFFEGFELVEFLGIDVSEIIERFEDEIESALDEIEELMQDRHGRPVSPIFYYFWLGRDGEREGVRD